MTADQIQQGWTGAMAKDDRCDRIHRAQRAIGTSLAAHGFTVHSDTLTQVAEDVVLELERIR